MAETNIASGSSLAIKQYSAALLANTLKTTTAMDNLVGPIEPTAAMDKVAGQSAPGMPIVRIDNLMKNPGDTVSLDLVDTISGEPLMGDINREGKGNSLSFSSMDIKIDLSSKVIDAGGSMSQQRTKWQLREIALAQLSGYFLACPPKPHWCTWPVRADRSKAPTGPFPFKVLRISLR